MHTVVVDRVAAIEKQPAAIVRIQPKSVVTWSVDNKKA
jgi:hypothetical protein